MTTPFLVESVVLDGRVYLDAAALIRWLRTTADDWEREALAAGDPIPDCEWDMVVARHTVATTLRDRADRLDLACLDRVNKTEPT